MKTKSKAPSNTVAYGIPVPEPKAFNNAATGYDRLCRGTSFTGLQGGIKLKRACH
eukprot:c51689_g1_i1 orf=228-392(-)